MTLKCQTKLLRYGDEYYNNRDKYKQTNLERFGFTNPNMKQEIKDKAKIKRKNTCLKLYGTDNIMRLKEYQQKAKQTILEKYGVEHSMQNEEVKNKLKQTMLNRYGVEHSMQLEDVKNKIKQTCLKKYGVENPQQNKDIKNKTIQTMIKKYGVENPQQVKEIHEKTIKTCLEKYGVENPMQNINILNKSFISRFKNSHGGTSKLEDNVHDYLILNIDNNTIRQHKDQLYPYFCDFYLPKYNLYLEINGMWTHNDHPYDENNIYDIETLNLWKQKALKSAYYKSAIQTWTIDDVNKRTTAKKNKLNYLEIFSNDLNIIHEKINQYINNEYKNI